MGVGYWGQHNQFGTARVVSYGEHHFSLADTDGGKRDHPASSGGLGEITGGWIFSRKPAVGSEWAIEPDVGRVANGVSARVDRLRGLGNAVVPQCAEYVGNCILEWEGLI